ncbi:MAG: NUDIX hydrolase [Planctomycetes bacterium]|nr:NUDIX hydrolase [Planctomycetota bacterium]
MHRSTLYALLDRYEARYPQDPTAGRIRAFAREHRDCLERSCRLGHITAGAWILDPCEERALLTHHRKLDRWLQLGGHVDGESDILRAAIREAREESGIEAFEVWVDRAGRGAWGAPEDGDAVVLDLDIHPIPARGAEPEHDHLDVRFLFRARSARLTISDESNDLRWFTSAEVASATDEESVLRLLHRAAALMGR